MLERKDARSRQKPGGSWKLRKSRRRGGHDSDAVKRAPELSWLVTVGWQPFSNDNKLPSKKTHYDVSRMIQSR